jgi:hypothetical protein
MSPAFAMYNNGISSIAMTPVSSGSFIFVTSGDRHCTRMTNVI